ncbi:hypothetical protein BKA65DRAFT_479169 [Rhexocercosporidium sp. MPI-PUGE-AT-0058]|nr:hypothetical protein BKA65DRAFT_479169 [Rhexocercosporidium sp. MPI-PUGE-AT-0058]
MANDTRDASPIQEKWKKKILSLGLRASVEEASGPELNDVLPGRSSKLQRDHPRQRSQEISKARPNRGLAALVKAACVLNTWCIQIVEDVFRANEKEKSYLRDTLLDSDDDDDERHPLTLATHGRDPASNSTLGFRWIQKQIQQQKKRNTIAKIVNAEEGDHETEAIRHEKRRKGERDFCCDPAVPEQHLLKRFVRVCDKTFVTAENRASSCVYPRCSKARHIDDSIPREVSNLQAWHEAAQQEANAILSPRNRTGLIIIDLMDDSDSDPESLEENATPASNPSSNPVLRPLPCSTSGPIIIDLMDDSNSDSRSESSSDADPDLDGDRTNEDENKDEVNEDENRGGDMYRLCYGAPAATRRMRDLILLW